MLDYCVLRDNVLKCYDKSFSSFILNFFSFSFFFILSGILNGILISKFIWLPYLKKLGYKNYKQYKQISEDSEIRLQEEFKQQEFSERYPLDKAKYSENVNLETCFINEDTPSGNIIMKYNEKEAQFEFWGNKNTPYFPNKRNSNKTIRL